MSTSGMKKVSGKKRSTGASAAGTGTAGGLKKIRGDWQRSSVDERQLEALRRDGLLPPLDKMATRAPGDEVTPRPRDGERVCFVDFVNRGFAFPVHEFVRGLMYPLATVCSGRCTSTQSTSSPKCSPVAASATHLCTSSATSASAMSRSSPAPITP